MLLYNTKKIILPFLNMINPPLKTYKCVYIKQVRVFQRECTVSSRDRKKLIRTKLRNLSINPPPLPLKSSKIHSDELKES